MRYNKTEWHAFVSVIFQINNPPPPPHGLTLVELWVLFAFVVGSSAWLDQLESVEFLGLTLHAFSLILDHYPVAHTSCNHQ